MKKPLVILVINPGSTSTKIALYEDLKPSKQAEITHPVEDLKQFKKSYDQLDFRMAAIDRTLAEWGIAAKSLDAVIGRGGPLKPMESGVYHVGKRILEDCTEGKVTDHVSLLGGLLAFRISEKSGIPSFIADPVSVDEFDDVARISGLPEIPRISLVHALNIKAVIRQACEEARKDPSKMNFIVAHLGGGFSIAASREGRIVDVNNANDGGPFSPERVGTLPLGGLTKLCMSGKFTPQELKKKLIGNGGLVAHLGTGDVREVEKRIAGGDSKAALILEAMAYAIAKEIGAMASVLRGKVDGIILTGGVAYSARVVEWIRDRVSFIAPVIVNPGQNEMLALARHALGALADPKVVKEYV